MSRRGLAVASLIGAGLGLVVILANRGDSGVSPGAPASDPLGGRTARRVGPGASPTGWGEAAPADAPALGVAALAAEVPRSQIVRSLTTVAELTPDQHEEVDTIVKALQGAEEAARSERAPEARARIESEIWSEGDRALATVFDEMQRERVRQYVEHRRLHGGQ